MLNEMLEDVQLLELSLDSQNGNTTRPPPKRAFSAPINHTLVGSNIEDENDLKSCPDVVPKCTTVDNVFEGIMIADRTVEEKDDVISDSPAIPSLRRWVYSFRLGDQ